jgi:hypothetical protein
VLCLRAVAAEGATALVQGWLSYRRCDDETVPTEQRRTCTSHEAAEQAQGLLPSYTAGRKGRRPGLSPTRVLSLPARPTAPSDYAR